VRGPDPTAATVAVQRETRTIPIVFVYLTDPVASGIVARLNQPGGNIIGFAIFEASLGLRILPSCNDALKVWGYRLIQPPYTDQGP
jgi:hypothetical protein